MVVGLVINVLILTDVVILGLIHGVCRYLSGNLEYCVLRRILLIIF